MDRMTSIGEGGTIAFGPDDCVFDTICGFRLGRDRLVFADGFFAPMTDRAPLSWRLRACNGVGGRALLAANTAWAGWQFIADFAGLDRATLAAAIADGRLVDGGGAAWRPLTLSLSPLGGEGTMGRGGAGGVPSPACGRGTG